MFVTILLFCCNYFCTAFTIGADTEAKNNNGMTPLMWACQNGYKEVSALLLEHGEVPLRIYIAEVFGMFCSVRMTLRA